MSEQVEQVSGCVCVCVCVCVNTNTPERSPRANASGVLTPVVGEKGVNVESEAEVSGPSWKQASFGALTAVRSELSDPERYQELRGGQLRSRLREECERDR